MSIPEQIDVRGLKDYLEILTKAIFQAGVSWKLVDDKWPAFREVFADFDPEKVAAFDQADIERLLQDARILRSPKKIQGTIENAKTILALDREFNGFKSYLRSKKSYKELSADIRKRFKYVGELSVYYFLFRVKEPVPAFEQWITTIEGEHPRMKEMVEHARRKNPQAAR
jgi:3-methyladenine DNA glycosylase Tag